jgi:hypothetical protein
MDLIEEIEYLIEFKRNVKHRLLKEGRERRSPPSSIVKPQLRLTQMMCPPMGRRRSCGNQSASPRYLARSKSKIGATLILDESFLPILFCRRAFLQIVK